MTLVEDADGDVPEVRYRIGSQCSFLHSHWYFCAVVLDRAATRRRQSCSIRILSMSDEQHPQSIEQPISSEDESPQTTGSCAAAAIFGLLGVAVVASALMMLVWGPEWLRSLATILLGISTAALGWWEFQANQNPSGDEPE
jgi:hypothetical protein